MKQNRPPTELTKLGSHTDFPAPVLEKHIVYIHTHAGYGEESDLIAMMAHSLLTCFVHASVYAAASWARCCFIAMQLQVQNTKLTYCIAQLEYSITAGQCGELGELGFFPSSEK